MPEPSIVMYITKERQTEVKPVLHWLVFFGQDTPSPYSHFVGHDEWVKSMKREFAEGDI